MLKTKGQGIFFERSREAIGVLDSPAKAGSLARPGKPERRDGEQYPDSLPGLTPVIFQINVIPLQDLPAVFLGVKENSSELSSLNN